MLKGFFSVTACQTPGVEILRDVVTSELESDLQVSYREICERGSNSEIVD